MDKSQGWHDDPEAGLRSRKPSAFVDDAAMVRSDGGRSYFPDVGFPAHREDIYRSAVAHGAPEALLEAIRNLARHVFPSAYDLPDLYERAMEKGPSEFKKPGARDAAAPLPLTTPDPLPPVEGSARPAIDTDVVQPRLPAPRRR